MPPRGPCGPSEGSVHLKPRPSDLLNCWQGLPVISGPVCPHPKSVLSHWVISQIPQPEPRGLAPCLQLQPLGCALDLPQPGGASPITGRISCTQGACGLNSPPHTTRLLDLPLPPLCRLHAQARLTRPQEPAADSRPVSLVPASSPAGRSVCGRGHSRAGRSQKWVSCTGAPLRAASDSLTAWPMLLCPSVSRDVTRLIPHGIHQHLAVGCCRPLCDETLLCSLPVWLQNVGFASL